MVRSLNDGLGGEEVGAVSTTLSINSPTGSAVFATVSGGHLYGTGSVLTAEGQFTTLKATTGTVTTLGTTTATIATSVNTLTSGGQISVAGSILSNDKRLSPVGAGSPTMTWGLLYEVGSDATGAGSSVWLVFPTAFSATPKCVQVEGIETAGDYAWAPAGSWQAGSCYVETKTASQAFSWTAIGAE